MKRLLATAALGAIVLAGCAVPELGTVNPAPITKTAPESALISTACRAQLGATPRGQDLLNATDDSLGFFQVEGNPAAEVSNALNAFHFSAVQLGATDC